MLRTTGRVGVLVSVAFLLYAAIDLVNGQLPFNTCIITNPVTQEVSPSLEFTAHDLDGGNDMCANSNSACNSIVTLLKTRCFNAGFTATCEKTCNRYYQQGKAVKAEVMKDCCDILGNKLHLIYSFRNGEVVPVLRANRIK